jgi:ABC-type glycerol-3-phosphate transport system permease component
MTCRAGDPAFRGATGTVRSAVIDQRLAWTIVWQFVFQAAGGLNGLGPIVHLSSPERFTLPRVLTRFVDVYGGPIWNVRLAASMTALPVLVVFVLARRRFVGGPARPG